MPFTPSHAVVALPFVRTPLLPAAVAIGSMTPDLSLFVRGTPVTYHVTHTNVAVAASVALVLVALWYGLLRPAVRSLSPRWLAARLPDDWDAPGLPRWWYRRRPAVSGALVIVSTVLGVVTHIVWDAFTHEGRWGTKLVPALAESWGPLPGLKWVQHGSSVAGLVVLAIAGALWLRRRAPGPVPTTLPRGVRRAWWASLPLALLAGWGIGLIGYGPLTDDWTAQHLAYRVLPPACAVWGALTVALCVVIVVRRRSVDPGAAE